MKPATQAAALVTILLVLSLAMGMSFGASGAGGGASNVSQSTVAPNRSPSSSPRIIVVAQGVNPSYLYQASFQSSIPQYMLEPLVGVGISLTSLNREIFSIHERVPAITFRTNASGIAYAVVAPGNYSVSIGGPNFNINTTMSFLVNSTTTFRLSLLPSGYAVTSLHLVSPDSASGVEPLTRISALLRNQSAPSLGFAEIVGYHLPVFSNGTSPVMVFPPVIFNATVIGTYPGIEGTWAVLSPTSSYADYPTVGVVLFQFRPVLEVSSVVG